MSSQDDIKKLIILSQRRLQKRKEQKARLGDSADPSIDLEIEDIQSEIEQLNKELADLKSRAESSSETDNTTSLPVPRPVTASGDSAAQPQISFDKPRILLCYASEDKPQVEKLYHQLAETGYDPWFDEYDLLPGQRRRREIERIIRDPYNLVVVCLSNNSHKEGVIQEEIKWALDVWGQMPEDTIYLIPLLLEPCDVPSQLADLKAVELYKSQGFATLERALQYELKKRVPQRRKARSIWLDSDSGELYQGETPLKNLSPLEKDVLSFFIKYPYVRHTKTDLIINIWPGQNPEPGAFDNSLYSVISRLRKTIEPSPGEPIYLFTWRGQPEGGYQFFPEGHPQSNQVKRTFQGKKPGKIWLRQDNGDIYQGRFPIKNLTPLEKAVLAFFIEAPHTKHTKTDLVNNIWPVERGRPGVSDNAVYQVIVAIRKEIEADPSNPIYLITRRGQPEGGYEFFPEGDAPDRQSSD